MQRPNDTLLKIIYGYVLRKIVITALGKPHERLLEGSVWLILAAEFDMTTGRTLVAEVDVTIVFSSWKLKATF